GRARTPSPSRAPDPPPRGSSTAAPARSRWAGTIHRLSGPAGRAASATETSPVRHSYEEGVGSLGRPSATVALHWESRSTISVCRPSPATQAPMLTAVVVLPTPP